MVLRIIKWMMNMMKRGFRWRGWIWVVIVGLGSRMMGIMMIDFVRFCLWVFFIWVCWIGVGLYDLVMLGLGKV
jgi:hypothetical protein